MKKRVDEYSSLYELVEKVSIQFLSHTKTYMDFLKYSSCPVKECDLAYLDHQLFYADVAIEQRERNLGTLSINITCGETEIAATTSGTIEYIVTDVLEYSTDGTNYNPYVTGIDATTYTEVWFRRTVTRSDISDIILYAHIDNSEGACTKTSYYKRDLQSVSAATGTVWGYAPNETWGYSSDKVWGYV